MNRTSRLIALLAAGSLALAACGDDDGGTAAADGGGSPSGGRGSIVISGSSTVEPISALVAERFRAEHGDVAISVDGPGTGDGFQLFCAGETDISDASRAIKDEEVEACEAAGVEYVELMVAYDGLSILTSAANDAVDCLSFADLYALLGPESTGFTRWSDADDLAVEVGARGGYPDANLVVTGPGEESGTYDSFVELVLAELAQERGQDEQTRPDYTSSPNDNVIIEGIAGSRSSLGWVGFAFAEEAGDTVRELAVDGGDGCVAPTIETIADGSYPISRPLFIYVNAQRAAEDEALAAYVDLYLSDEGTQAVSDVGYVPLPDDLLVETRAAWTSR